MSAIEKETAATRELGELKTRLKTIWMSGDYDVFSRFMEKDAERFFRNLGIAPKTQVLDVACGSGQLALIAARAGSRVHGCDIATNWIEKARERAAAESLDARFEEGDAESLPYENAKFDVVTTLFGAMFAPRPERVAAELTRVCKPGGFIAMGNWTPGGFVGQMFKTIARHIAPSGMPAPVLWGDEDSVRNRLRHGIAELKLTRRICQFEYPFPPDAVVDFFRTNYGPMSRAFASLDAEGQEKLRSELVQLWSSHNLADGSTTKVDAEYLEVVAIRAQEPKKVNQGSVGQRAESLANRIETGAAGLAAFAEGLTEKEWRTPISAGGNDSRSVGAIVYHVAAVYPIEIELARAIAGGKAVTDVTWEVVAGLNAQHATEQADVTREAALELLRRNSREAAAAVRTFTDAELDQAAPFSLCYGAPVTAQFVIEDHAVRHSWHHLARIRKTLSR